MRIPTELSTLKGLDKSNNRTAIAILRSTEDKELLVLWGKAINKI